MKCWYSLKQQLVGNEGVLFCTLVIVKGSFVQDMQMAIKKWTLKNLSLFKLFFFFFFFVQTWMALNSVQSNHPLVWCPVSNSGQSKVPWKNNRSSIKWNFLACGSPQLRDFPSWRLYSEGFIPWISDRLSNLCTLWISVTNSHSDFSQFNCDLFAQTHFYVFFFFLTYIC